ncbi:Type IIS restriction enzyme Eco57I [Yersinia pseudotuberculosis]|nr:Type IIS restriction enzyme Eco57I [Yersinia pseudotuberculosis]SUQ38076.1 Type IIS restriction enzyme Eco57I [Yersinia pseudotuberculosis]
MKNNLISYLKKNNLTEPNQVDRLIISAYYKINKITPIHNRFILTYLINDTEQHEDKLLQELCCIINTEIKNFGFEELIQFFEFVVSPSDRVINGAIYTPQNIRKYITHQCLNKVKNINEISISDIACGCGGFLYNAAKYINKATNKCYFDIFKDNIFGIDIQGYSITRAKLLLITLAISNKEDKEEFSFNLFTDDTLSFSWKHHIENFSGFDVIIGNPPYVCSRNMPEETKEKLSLWSVCASGQPDLYIPFFQIGIELLSRNGILGYITMNSFFKSLNGRALRKYFKEKKLNISIIDFGSEQVFISKNTYTCICIIKNEISDYISYQKTESKHLPIKNKDFEYVYYSDLDSLKGWNLHNHNLMSKIESIGKPFGSIYQTRHGIATLKNDVYIFKPAREDLDYYYLQKEKTYKIEKGICRDIINSNKLSTQYSLNEIVEKVIFPYSDDDKPVLFKENYLQENFPNAYLYLLENKNILLGRDKGKRVYPNWFAFGRTQSLEKIKNKLFLPKISNTPPNSILSTDSNLMFYNGIAIVGHEKEELLFIQKIIESKIFWHYITTTSKPYSSNYYSLNGNYINNFGIHDFTNEEIEYIISEATKENIDFFIERQYGINIST